MFDVDQFAEGVVKPSLLDVDMYSPSAEQLLVCTAAAESRLGTYLMQVNGPALGVFQMEPATHDDIWDHYLLYRGVLKQEIVDLTAHGSWSNVDRRPEADLMIHDLRYAAIMARLQYRRVPFPLPPPRDWNRLARYWKEHYNTALGRGTMKHFLKCAEDCGVISYYNQRSMQ